MSTVLILGDVHLGKSLSQGRVGIGSNLNSRIVDQLNLLDWTLDQAIESSIDHIIITGDIFEDPRPHPSLITLFISWLKKCQANSVHVHLILGNHDMLRSGFVYSSPLDIISEVELENVDVYKNINTITIGTTAITLVPFRDRKSFGASTNNEALSLLKQYLIYELASIPITYRKVLIGHLAIEGSIPVGDEIDDISNELFCPLDIFNGYDYVWMGHVHKPQIMKKKEPYIAHIGSMDISNFGETEQNKHIVLFNCSLRQQFITKNLPTRPLKKISIVVPNSVEDTTEYVLQHIKDLNKDLHKSTIKIEISLEGPELQSPNKSVIEKYLINHGAFNVTNISESKKIFLIKKDNSNILDTKMDVPSTIKNYSSIYIEENQKSDFINLAMEIYNSYKAELKE